MYIQSCALEQELGFGIQQQFVLLGIPMLFYFGYMPLLNVIGQMDKEEKMQICVIGCK